MNRFIAFILLATCGTAFAATKYPFPQSMNYPNGIRPTLAGINNWTINNLQSDFDFWKSNFYAECSDGQRARVKWTDPAASAQGCSPEGGCTVSEGIGYGMLILVYMDNATNNTQAQFDKLWRYYNSYPDSKGLMKWIINGCDGAKADGAATDAEMDVALALAMAYKQWGKESYKTDLAVLLKKIWDSEVDQGNKVLKSGSLWSDPYNPSYFATGALRVFAQVDTDKSHNWTAIADGCLALIKKNQHATTGLVSDWCNSNGTSVDKNGSGTNKFGYDAARTPWRVTLDYLWHGTPAAKEAMQKIAAWLKASTGENVTKIKAQYNTDGTTSVTDWSNALYWGAFTMPNMVDPSNSAWLQQLSKRMNQNPDNYYQVSWQILYRLTLSGSFQNYWGTLSSGIEESTSSNPANWNVVSKRGTITLTLPGSGSVDLVDAGGVVVASAAGRQKIEMARPAQRGVYFAVVRAEGQRVVLPVVGD